MNATIRDISPGELTLFADMVGRLERLEDDCDVREMVFPTIVKLLRADFGASYVWNDKAKRFDRELLHNISVESCERYNTWFQFRDPMTQSLRSRRTATLVEEVSPLRDLVHTEFYNDFLRVDGLYNGVNIYLFDGDRDLGDFRLWRAKGRPEFSERDTLLLNAIAPFVQRAIMRSEQRYDDLTSREKQVAFLVARGCRDRDIGEMLKISFSTVRTHVNRAMEKKGCANRAELAAAVMKTSPHLEALS